MSDNSVSEFGAVVSKNKSALEEAFNWFDALINAFHKGRGDNDIAARGRVADAAGITDSYAYRLQYKRSEMRKVDGQAYRGLMLAYVELCQNHEKSASAKRAERMEISDEIDQIRSLERV